MRVGIQNKDCNVLLPLYSFGSVSGDIRRQRVNIHAPSGDDTWLESSIINLNKKVAHTKNWRRAKNWKSTIYCHPCTTKWKKIKRGWAWVMTQNIDEKNLVGQDVVTWLWIAFDEDIKDGITMNTIQLNCSSEVSRCTHITCEASQKCCW